MHQAGGSGGRKKAFALRGGKAARDGGLGGDTKPLVSGKMSHTRAVLSLDAVTMRLPSGLNAALTHLIRRGRGAALPIGLPVSASHTRAVLSADAVTMRLPSGLNAALHTASVMAFERLADRLAGLGVPQPRRLVPRRGDDALAVGAERRALTPQLPWPVSGAPIGLPVAASHSRAVLSADAVTMRLPSGLNAALAHSILRGL